ncbi:hypothetical protein MLAC_40160 [Mycobacterium lacus]|uniref:Uncharacterized protein n=1 Tax=Mycobacterium lacus TaxID=169765 RepID=A0A7I7NQ07_9MYCO|nr:hypothetical protein MLAC_40160 [Mycobacterium lacus]
MTAAGVIRIRSERTVNASPDIAPLRRTTRANSVRTGVYLPGASSSTEWFENAWLLTVC